MRIHLRRPTREDPPAGGATATPSSDRAAVATPALRVSQRGFLKALAAAGLVGVGEAALAPQVAEASYVNGTPNDTATNNLLIQGNVEIGQTYNANRALGITWALSGGNLLSGIVNTPSLTYQSAATLAWGLFSKPAYHVNAAVTSLLHLEVDTTGVTIGTGGSITNQVGIYVTAPTGATSNYAVYVAGGTSYLGGAVAIGTTTPTASPPALLSVGTTSQFQVNSSGAVTSSGSVTFSGLGTGVVHAGAAGLLSSAAVSLASSDVSGVLPIANGGTNNGASYTAGSVIFFDGTMLNQNNIQLFWDNANYRLGIGTPSPGFPLDVVGNNGYGWGQGTLRVSGNNSDVMLHVVNTSSGGRDFSIDSAGNASGLGSGKLHITDVTAQAARLTIDSLGNVGVGTLTPQASLDVAGTVKSSYSFEVIADYNGTAPARPYQIYLQGLTNTNLKMYVGFDTTNKYGLIQAVEEGAVWRNIVLARDGGSVGIGTWSPSALLDVNGTIAASGSASITASPPSVSGNLGWKIGLWANQYAIGIANYSIAMASAGWLSLFGYGQPPANNANASAPDSSAKVSLGVNGQIRSGSTLVADNGGCYYA